MLKLLMLKLSMLKLLMLLMLLMLLLLLIVMLPRCLKREMDFGELQSFGATTADRRLFMFRWVSSSAFYGSQIVVSSSKVVQT